jgi:hyperosmotically inducible periplasmic protein
MPQSNGSVWPLFASVVLATTLSACSIFEGPQAVQLQDDVISADVKAKLYRDDIAQGARINVAVDDGAVRLDGSVNSQQQKIRAEEIARATRGVRSVANNLRVAENG